MSENPFVTDLRFAQQTGHHVELRTYSGQHFKFNAVVEVCDAA